MPDQETPDLYADQFIVTNTVWGTNISFLKMPPHPSPGQAPQPIPQVVVRMSLQHAKVMTMMLRRQLKQWERDNGMDIGVPHSVYAALGVSPEDW